MKYTVIIVTAGIQEQYPPDAKQIAFFKQRQRMHEAFVRRNALRIARKFKGVSRQLLSAAQKHDASKWTRNEYIPYIWLTSNKQLGYSYPSAGLERLVDKAWQHHYMSNPHHPEHWQTRYHSLERMPSYEVAHMVADWAAMSQELHNSLRQWWRKAQRQYKFTERQQKFISAIISVFPELH